MISCGRGDGQEWPSYEPSKETGGANRTHTCFLVFPRHPSRLLRPQRGEMIDDGGLMIWYGRGDGQEWPSYG